MSRAVPSTIGSGAMPYCRSSRPARSIRAANAASITVSLDDFGTGYSSLSYLKGFPVDTLKIDRSFVCDLATSPDDATITAAIISMANTLNLRVVAEGYVGAEWIKFVERIDAVITAPFPAEAEKNAAPVYVP